MDKPVGAMIDRPFVVKNTLSFGRELHGMGNNLSMNGMMLETPAEVLDEERFLWLEFQLDDSGHRIKALGEIVERQDSGVKIRFKHLYPSDRKKLAIQLDTTTYH